MSAWFRKSGGESDGTRAPLDPESAAQKLRDFIAGKSKLVQASEIGSDTKLFSSGLLDSLAFVELALFVEKEFRVKLADMIEVNMDSLDSIEQILRPIIEKSENP
jgi:acyl carrier protein